MLLPNAVLQWSRRDFPTDVHLFPSWLLEVAATQRDPRSAGLSRVGSRDAGAVREGNPLTAFSLISSEYAVVLDDPSARE
jgi:hypothetical protein